GRCDLRRVGRGRFLSPRILRLQHRRGAPRYPGIAGHCLVHVRRDAHRGIRDIWDGRLTMSNGIVGPYSNLPAVFAAQADEAEEAKPTAEQEQIAKDFPAGMVQLENKGAQLAMQIPGGLLALGGATLLGISLLSRKAPGAIESRLLASPLLFGGGMVAAGA